MPRKCKKKAEQWPCLEFEESPKSVHTSDLPSPFSHSDHPMDAEVVAIEPDQSLYWVSPQFIRGRTPHRRLLRRNQTIGATQRLLRSRNMSGKTSQRKINENYVPLKLKHEPLNKNVLQPVVMETGDEKVNKDVYTLQMEEETDSEPPPGFGDIHTPDLNDLCKQQLGIYTIDPSDCLVETRAISMETQRTRSFLRKRLFNGITPSNLSTRPEIPSMESDHGITSLNTTKCRSVTLMRRSLFSSLVRTPNKKCNTENYAILVKDTPEEDYHLTVRQRALRRFRDRRRISFYKKLEPT